MFQSFAMSMTPTPVRMVLRWLLVACCGCLLVAFDCSPGLAQEPPTAQRKSRNDSTVFAIVWMGDRAGEKSNSSNQQIRTQLLQIRGAGYQATLISPDVDRYDLAAYDVVVLPNGWDAWTSANKEKSELLNRRGEEFRSYISNGGVLWMLQPNPYLRPESQCSPTLAPYPITFRNAFQTTDDRTIEIKEHPLVAGKTIDKTWLPQHYDTVISRDDKWQVIASSDGNPSILEARYGDGLCFVTPASPLRFHEVFCDRVCRYLARQSKAPLSTALKTDKLPPPTDEPPTESVANLTLESLQTRRECESALISQGANALSAIAAVVEGGAVTDVDAGEIDLLIEKLGNPAYQVRQNAYLRLQRLGHIPLAALREGQKSKIREVAYRCRLLIARLTDESAAASLTDEKESDRPRSLVRVLAAIDHPDAKKQLERLTRSKSLVVARMARYALQSE